MALSDMYSCPVCKEDMVLPRLFPHCGHSLCTGCHIELDRRARSRLIGLSEVKCPLCRKGTTLPTALRPLNHFLHTLMETKLGAEYRKACENARQRLDEDFKTAEISDFSCKNLRTMCERRRKELSRCMYQQVVRMVGYAAMRGMPVVVISDEGIVADCVKVLDILKEKLFVQNNIHSIRYCNITNDITVEIANVTIQNMYTNSP